jgi:predicted ATP-dependent serine protease
LSQFCTSKPHPEPNIRENFSIITARDIKETAREEVPVIKGLLAEAENLEIVGPSGIGKSLLTLNIALNLGMPSTDKSLWGIFNIPNQFKTLFIQSENSLLGIKKRLGLILKGDPRYEPAMDKLIFPHINGDCRTSGNVTDPHFQHFLKEMIYATDSKVVVVDPLISFHHANENDNAEMRKYLDTLTRISIETRTSLILIHHVGKASSGAVGGGRGASSIGDWADNVLSLEPGKDNMLKVTHQKSRHFRTHPQFYLERTGTLDFKRVTPESDDEGEIVKEALEALDGEAETQDMLADKMVEMGCSSKSKAKRWIKKAENSGLVGEVRNGKAVGYSLKQD